MASFSLVTINILNDLSLWPVRGPLLVEQLAALSPDLIAMQEVSLQGESSNAHWVAEQLNQRNEKPDKIPPYQVALCPKTGRYATKEGLAVLSRLPVRAHEQLDLLTQNRVAQIVRFRFGSDDLLLVNLHLFWQPGISPERQKQVELLLDFLDTQPVELPVLICGDFNGMPGTPSIERMREYFDSAYNVIHKQEPDYTAPTPLLSSSKTRLRKTIAWAMGRRPKPDPTWRGTLDYIFVDPRLHTEACEIVLNHPADDNPQIYPSDHFGLFAEINLSAV
ncbi:MAG TPA: endonuclease/exonuclease/phosphatase family protein [Anaerolineales bacterium]|nr:endonuclease/exonuclease/phosphatase family protein [Anaerolineales bacterium]